VELRKVFGEAGQGSATRVVVLPRSVAVAVVVESRGKVSNLARGRVCKLEQAVLYSAADGRGLFVEEGNKILQCYCSASGAEVTERIVRYTANGNKRMHAVAGRVGGF
jgi:hypothetical protein